MYWQILSYLLQKAMGGPRDQLEEIKRAKERWEQDAKLMPVRVMSILILHQN